MIPLVGLESDREDAATSVLSERIENDTQMRDAIVTIGGARRPPMVLRGLMRLLEAYRARRKMGWSRPWNKDGVTTFRAYRLDPVADAAILEQASDVLRSQLDLPEEARAFARSLISDTSTLMAFMFFSEYLEAGDRYEIATLSLGRQVPSARRFRDRFDIILDAPVEDRRTAPLSRTRLFIDPFDSGSRRAPWVSTMDGALPVAANELFATLSALSWTWRDDPSRRWEHWTSAYVDYFGPRTFALKQSPFCFDESTCRPVALPVAL